MWMYTKINNVEKFLKKRLWNKPKPKIKDILVRVVCPVLELKVEYRNDQLDPGAKRGVTKTEKSYLLIL